MEQYLSPQGVDGTTSSSKNSGGCNSGNLGGKRCTGDGKGFETCGRKGGNYVWENPTGCGGKRKCTSKAKTNIGKSDVKCA